MAMTCTDDDETALLISHHLNQEQEDEDEEEALSLCDLPVNSLPNENNSELRSIAKEDDEEFEFGIGSSFRAGSDSCEPAPEMSTADELFFKGRILPLRHSVSLDAGAGLLLPEPTRLITRSESVEYRRTGINRSDRKIKNNNFIDYSQPSPQPQIRRSSSMTARVNSIRNPKSSTIWDFLRLGLVRTPEIELRTNGKVSVSRNSSCSSTSTNSNSKKTGETTTTRSRSRRRSFLFSDCKCSTATETMTVVPVKIKDERKVVEKKTSTAKKEEKTAMARKRTFDWLKELSQVGFVVDHGRRSLV
ncbi:PREDICTED: uncharacterized protein LOC104727293 isoform X1 [Camelina sativa]|uniref:Uncharacterized protein LOC104727293 isoform X1 n=1 Tax=Camelina sativa TaxID=90675 RepID=A0ABM1QMU3_CAMSA|nr:PREDICTED: uncharacterized protein LOC104727293 isoform X1 [Camelina sativa]